MRESGIEYVAQPLQHRVFSDSDVADNGFLLIHKCGAIVDAAYVLNEQLYTVAWLLAYYNKRGL